MDNNPITGFDPYGHAPCGVGAGATGGVLFLPGGNSVEEKAPCFTVTFQYNGTTQQPDPIVNAGIGDGIGGGGSGAGGGTAVANVSLNTFPSPNNAGHIAGCFAKGAVVGAAGALVAGGLAVGAVALGAPVAVVSGVLLVAGGIGAGVTGALAINDISKGNYASASYGIGSLAGGVVAGGARASNTVFGMTGSTGTPFRGLASEASMFINPRLGPISGAFAKGPTQAGAAGATGGLGSALTWLGGCSQ